LQLSIEWGWDHDSYAQLLGAFIGAMYGPEIFPSAMRETVANRLILDYNEDQHEWVDLLMSYKKMGRSTKLFEAE
jgi:ADP-ribosylglycohydrolase